MKALFISYNQALTESIIDILDRRQVRGYTLFPLTHGRGSFTGEPHNGTHAWPTMNSSTLTIADEEHIEAVMTDLRELDKQTQLQGMRFFAWEVTDQM